MAMFNSYVKLPEGNGLEKPPFLDGPLPRLSATIHPQLGDDEIDESTTSMYISSCIPFFLHPIVYPIIYIYISLYTSGLIYIFLFVNFVIYINVHIYIYPMKINSSPFLSRKR